ncbi:MAG: hypothetical protein QG577_2335 [Thermodesulfobacteriota bacterium]|nr:hypothetical protein [Thermodesulfobacteriota bacterium]
MAFCIKILVNIHVQSTWLWFSPHGGLPFSEIGLFHQRLLVFGDPIRNFISDFRHVTFSLLHNT